MSPAFSSLRQAGAFALLLLVLLLSPLLVGQALLPSREQMYGAAGGDIIDFPRLHAQIFEEKGDVDIAILGSSRLGCAIDADYLQQKLSAKLGRPAVVRSMTWTWNGYDALYFIAHDLLEHRKVHTILVTDLSEGAGDLAHHQTSYWFRYADNAGELSGLPLKSKLSFYASAILGLPRNLVGRLRENGPLHPVQRPPWAQSAVDFNPPSADPAAVQIYAEGTQSEFTFADRSSAKLQTSFARRFVQLARDRGTQVIFLHVPNYDDRKFDFINETIFAPGLGTPPVPLLGISSAKLFAGLSDADIDKLYYNPTHFNQNGRRLFTPVVTPAILDLYETHP